jgi:dienelactone hydrolase
MKRPLNVLVAALLSPALLCFPALAQEPAKPADTAKVDTSRGDAMLASYFALETEKLRRNCLAEIETLDDWNAKRGEYRRQLLEMLGLDPLPERTDLKAEVTGRVEQDDFLVENVHFQSRPGLYVTGNLYRPKEVKEPLPAILYLCGHGAVKKDGVSYGNKVHYQHHGAWFARNGYVCLTIDSLQLGEIEGIHHGTHRYGMWWWLNRGYTPAGVEAWNCVRALDYLESRPEVDKSRFGVTGRSGGGAYSWWIAAIDERIKAAVPVAGITDLENHVVDGCVEGHCDCMYMVNTYQWDYPLVAALVAPRPLLISNTDTDGIFPLDGVYRTFEKVRRIYRLYDATEKGTSSKIALNISPGPHKDTQELQVHAFRWFNHYLKGDDNPIEKVATPYFTPEQLQVFKTLPSDQKNTEIHETFVPAAAPGKLPADDEEWKRMGESWTKALNDLSFRDSATPFTIVDPVEIDRFGPRLAVEIDSAERHGMRFAIYDFGDTEHFPVRLCVLHRAGLKKADLKVLNVLDEQAWREFASSIRVGFEPELHSESLPKANDDAWKSTKELLEKRAWVMLYVAPRGIGPTAWNQTDKKLVQNQRRFYLLGKTLDGDRIADVYGAMQCAASIPAWKDAPLWLQSQRSMAGVTLYTTILHGKNIKVERMDLYDLPKSHRDGPYFLNVQRILDMPQALAMAAERAKVVLYQDDETGWEYPQAVAQKLGWDAKQIQIRKKPQ